MPYEVSSGQISSGVVLTNDTMQVYAGGIAYDTVADTDGRVYILSGGLAKDTSVNSLGVLFGWKGGVISNVTIASGGGFVISSGAVIRGTLQIDKDADIITYSGAIFDLNLTGRTPEDDYLIPRTSISSKFFITVAPDQTCGTYKIAQEQTSSPKFTIGDGCLEYFTISTLSPAKSFDGKTYSLIKNSDGNLFLDITVSSTTIVDVIENLLIDYSSYKVTSGVALQNATISSGGWVYVSSGGVINDATIYSDGHLFIYSEALISNTIISGGEVKGSGTIYNTTLSSGSLILGSGVARNTTVNSGGTMNVLVSGVAYDSIINSGGIMKINNCDVYNTIVSSGGELSISNDGIIRGRLQIESGAVVSAYTGAIVDFTLKGRSADSDYLVNDLSRIYGTPTYTITVDINQGFGSYKLAQGAADFTGSITISDGTVNYGTVTVNGENLIYDNKIYSLILNEGDLTMNIIYSETAPGVFIYDNEELVFSGNAVNETTVNKDSELHVLAGGTATTTTVNENGFLYVFSGGVADSAAINPGGSIEIASGGTATNITAVEGAKLALAVAPNTYIQGTSAGSDFAVSDATLSGFQVNAGNYIGVSNGGIAAQVAINDSGKMYIYNGGIANETSVNAGGVLYVSKGGIANDTIVNSDGRVNVFSNGTASDTTIDRGGEMYVYNNGVADDVTVNPGGKLYVLSDGSANIAFTPWKGTSSIDSNAVVTSLGPDAAIYYGNSGAGLISKGDAISQLNITEGNEMYVYSGGNANDIQISENGTMKVSSGGTVDNVIVDPDGELNVNSCATVTNIVAASGAKLRIAVAENTHIQGTVADSAFEMKDAYISGYTVTSGGRITICDNGVVDDILLSGGPKESAVENDCIMYISSGGVANRTDVNNARISAFSGGVASDTLVNSNGSMFISSGAVAENTTINGYGLVRVLNGGTATNVVVRKLGNLTISSGGTASLAFDPWQGTVFSLAGAVVETLDRDASIYYGGLTGFISKGDTFSQTQITSGNSMLVYSGGVAADTIVAAGGSIHVSSGGTLRGTLQISSGGEVISSGTEFEAIVPNGAVSIDEGGVIELSISDRTVENDFIINDLSLVSGAPSFTVTVDENQAFGTYKLANGAENFAWSITVTDGNTDYGTLSMIENSFNYNEKLYTLAAQEGALTLSIADYSDKIAPTITISGNVTSWTNSDVVLFAEASDNIAVDRVLYHINDGDWFDYDDDGVVVTENADVEFKVVDTFGNTASTVVVVDKIDKIAPTINIAKTGNRVFTDDPVTIAATFADNVAVATKEYKVGDGEWQDYVSGVKMTANGTVSFRATDTAGNEAIAQYAVSEITDDNWSDLKSKGAASLRFNKLGAVTKASQKLVTSGKLAANDTVDYYQFTLAKAAKITFTVKSGAAGKFTISKLTGSAGSYALKNLQSTALKKNTAVTTKELLLATGTYYFAVTDTDKKSASYTVTTGSKSVFYTKGDNGYNNKICDKVTSAGSNKSIKVSDWVGFGDAVDFYKFTLTSAAKMIFSVKAGDAAKFVIYNASGKALQTTTLKKNATVNTKELLMKAGTYYFSVTSTTASKGASVAYTVTTNTKSVFYTKADNGFNNKICDKVTSAGSNKAVKVSDWVGFSDAVDFYKFTLTSAAKMVFTVKAGDAAKFVIYNASGKALQTTTLKKNATVNTKDLLLKAGTYYFSVTSTNASKGASVAYTVNSAKSTIYPAATTNDNSWSQVAATEGFNAGDYFTGWVGYGDAKDFCKFNKDSKGKLKLTFDSATASEISKKELQISVLDSKGKSVAMKASKNFWESTASLGAGTYYIGAICANTSKFDSKFKIKLG